MGLRSHCKDFAFYFEGKWGATVGFRTEKRQSDLRFKGFLATGLRGGCRRAGAEAGRPKRSAAIIHMGDDGSSG